MAKVLGKGLQALIKNYSSEDTEYQDTILIENIIINKHQPRKQFNNEKIQNLMASIKSKGIMQPLTVRKIDDKIFELIAGERRLRAAKLLNMKNVPVYVLNIKEEAEMMEYALIENIQRVDLNPLEEAEGYNVLKLKYNYTQNEIGKKVGKSRSEIANKLRLLALPEKIKKGIHNNKLSYGHARLLLSLKDSHKMLLIYNKILSNNLSLKQTEQLLIKKKSKDTSKLQKNIFKKEIARLSQALKTETAITLKNLSEQGIIKIKFDTVKQLQKIIKQILK